MRALIFSLLLALAPAAAAAPAPPVADFKALMKDQGPAVVNIIAVRQPAGGEGVGSGFIISEDGYILTNAHLVADASDVNVRLADAKREFRARVIGADARSDVALLKVEASGLPTARLGSSAPLEAGDWVAAIGSPFGFANTITAGIVSAKGRALPQELYIPFIQTDVAVNPGNSGGPLLNLKGEVVGINSLIYSGTGGYMGVSFAIPIEVAIAVSSELKARGKVTRGRAGIGVQPLTEALARSFGLASASGAIIVNLESGGPAERAGARIGDVVLEWNGARVVDPGELPRWVAATPPGSSARMTVSRGGERRLLELTVGELPAEAQAAPASEAKQARLGISLRELTAAERLLLGVGYGLVVRQAALAPGAGDGLLAGDVIIGIGGRPLQSREDFDRILATHAGGASVPLLVRRGEAALYVPLALGAGG